MSVDMPQLGAPLANTRQFLFFLFAGRGTLYSWDAYRQIQKNRRDSELLRNNSRALLKLRRLRLQSSLVFDFGFQIPINPHFAAGYEDYNDTNHLQNDPVLRLAIGKGHRAGAANPCCRAS